jgi:hypothetical protein
MDFQNCVMTLWGVTTYSTEDHQVLKNYLKYSCIPTQVCQVSKSVKFNMVLLENAAAAAGTLHELFHDCKETFYTFL